MTDQLKKLFWESIGYAHEQEFPERSECGRGIQPENLGLKWEKWNFLKEILHFFLVLCFKNTCTSNTLWYYGTPVLKVMNVYNTCLNVYLQCPEFAQHCYCICSSYYWFVINTLFYENSCIHSTHLWLVHTTSTRHILSGLFTAFPGSNSRSVLLSHTSSANQHAHGNITAGSPSVGTTLTLSTNSPLP